MHFLSQDRYVTKEEFFKKKFSYVFVSLQSEFIKKRSLILNYLFVFFDHEIVDAVLINSNKNILFYKIYG